MTIRHLPLTLLLVSIILLAVAPIRPPRAVQAFETLCTVSPSGGADFVTVQAAVNETHCDIVQLTAGVYVETISIPRNLVLEGAGADRTIIDGDRAGSVFLIQQGAVVSIAHMTIRHGLGNGGGIANEGTLTLSDSTIRNNNGVGQGGLARGGGIFNAVHATMTLSNTTVISNTAYGDMVVPTHMGWGGGMVNDGTLTIIASTIANNTATHGGGGIYNAATLTMTESTIARNTAGLGGGILNDYTTTLINTTISGNSASSGAGITNGGMLRITNTTIISNTATASDGAGGIDSPGTTQLRNSIVAYNQPANCRSSGTMISQGHNLSSDSSCTLADPADQPNTNPQLGPLKDNGGPTLTHALVVGSSAIDAASNDGCPAVDQRGVQRPQDGDGDGLVICDIGAYEVTGIVTPPTVTVTPSPSPPPPPTVTPSPTSTPLVTPTVRGTSPDTSTLYLPLVRDT